MDNKKILLSETINIENILDNIPPPPINHPFLIRCNAICEDI